MNTPFTTNRHDEDEARESSPSLPAANDLFLRVIALETGIGLLGVAIIAVFNTPILGKTLTSLLNLSALALGTCAGAAAAGAILLLLRLFPSLLRSPAMQVLALFRDISVSQALFLGLAAGIGEELFFRGALQPQLGILVTSIIFALFHPIGWLYVTVAFSLSLGLGWLAVLTGGLAAPAAAHACYDALLFLALKLKVLPIPSPPPNGEL